MNKSFFTSRNKKIILFITFYIVVLGILFAYNLSTLNNYPCGEESCIRVYGNVSEEKYIGLSELIDTSTTYEKVVNRKYEMLNSFGTKINLTLSGVSLWDILDDMNILNNNATLVRFEANDGYRGPDLPIELLNQSSTEVILITHVNGIRLRSKSEGGDGPIMSFVSLDLIKNSQEVLEIFQNTLGNDFIYNSPYKVKYLSAIYVI